MPTSQHGEMIRTNIISLKYKNQPFLVPTKDCLLHKGSINIRSLAYTAERNEMNILSLHPIALWTLTVLVLGHPTLNILVCISWTTHTCVSTFVTHQSIFVIWMEQNTTYASFPTIPVLLWKTLRLATNCLWSIFKVQNGPWWPSMKRVEVANLYISML